MFFQRGQATILALLLGLFGLTVSLSVASRSLSDLRQVTVVDQGTKALAAAEAGVEYALYAFNQLNSGPNCGPSQALPVAGLSLANITGVTYNICTNTADFGIYQSVSQDDVVQVYIGGQQANVKGFRVLWKNPNASIEIIKINDNNGMVRYPYNSMGTDPAYLAKVSGNSFAPSVAGSQCYRDGNNASPCGDSSYNNSTSSCAGYWGEIPYSKNNPGDQYLRIKPLYGSSDIVVCSDPAGGSSGRLQLQYVQVTAIATSSGGVTKKVQTTQVANFLPAIFDNVIYSGGSLTK